jgi:hypothetical protein
VKPDCGNIPRGHQADRSGSLAGLQFFKIGFKPFIEFLLPEGFANSIERTAHLRGGEPGIPGFSRGRSCRNQIPFTFFSGKGFRKRTEQISKDLEGGYPVVKDHPVFLQK